MLKKTDWKVISMSKTFRQNDSRWGNFVYTRGGSTMAHAGCGPTSLAEIICNNPKYADITPLDVAKWLKKNGYNVQGTTWEGIKACLEHYGFKVASPDTMQRLFELLEKGQYKWGILNFKAGSRGGVTWTNGGHYVAFSDYNQKNGDDLLYTRDPGQRHNDGWHSYQKTMRGLVKKVWCCYLKDEQKTVERKFDGKWIDVSEHQGKVDWETCPTGHVIIRPSYTSTGHTFKLKTDKYWKRNIKATKDRHVEVYHFSQALTPDEARKEAKYIIKLIEPYRKRIKIVAFDFETNKSWRFTPDICKSNGRKKNGKIVDAFCSVIKAAGYEPMVYANSSTLNAYLPEDLYKKYKIWVAEYPSHYTDKSRPNYSHFYLWQYSSTGRVKGITPNVDLDKKYAKVKLEKYGGKFPTLPKRGYFQNGDKGENVKRLQRFLSWYGYNLAVDGSYGPKTADAVSRFEKAEGLKVDGSFGKKCLAKAKGVMR